MTKIILMQNKRGQLFIQTTFSKSEKKPKQKKIKKKKDR